jgi:PAS domain S-box-containing protein
MEPRPPDSELCGHAVQAAGVGVWAWDAANEELSADARCEDIMAATDAIGVARRSTMFRIAVAAQDGFDYEHRLTTVDGDARWVRLSGRALRDDAGEVVRCVGVMREVTDEHRLRESEERLRVVVSAAHDGVWELDVPSGRLWWSDDMLATLGVARDRCPRDLETALDLVHPEDREIARAQLAEVVAGRSPARRRTVRMRGGDGGWRQIEAWAVAATDPESGDAARVVGIVHDRTDAGRREDRSRELARRLNESVLAPLEVAVRHVKLAALALGSTPAEAGDPIDVSAAQLDLARDAVEDVIQSVLLRPLDGDD